MLDSEADQEARLERRGRLPLHHPLPHCRLERQVQQHPLCRQLAGRPQDLSGGWSLLLIPLLLKFGCGDWEDGFLMLSSW